MLKEVKRADFEKVLGEQFTIHFDGQNSLELVLAEVTTLGKYADTKVREEDRRIPFSLLFKSSAAHNLVQNTYTIENNTIGSYDIFLVPVSLTELEAIFN